MKFKLVLFSFMLVLSSLFAQAQNTTTDLKKRAGERVELQQAASAQNSDGGIIDYGNVNSFFEEGSLGILYAAATAILAYIGGFAPGLRNIKPGYVRSGAVIFALLAAIATFKFGAFTEQFFNTIFSTFFPNFAFSGMLFEGIKVVLKLFGIELPKPNISQPQTN